MRMVNIIWAGLIPAILVGALSFARAQPASDEAAIIKLWKDIADAYNSGDAPALAQFWDKDGDLFSLSGGIFTGREEIRAFFSEALSKSYKGSRFQLTIDKIRMLGDSTAVVDGTWNITGETLPQGYPSSGMYTQVLVRTKGDWLIVVARPSVPLRGHTRRHGRKAPVENLE